MKSLQWIREEGRRLGQIVFALSLLACSQGCVFSTLPLLDERTTIFDSSLAGHYEINSFLIGRYDVFFKGGKYVIADPSPSPGFFVATLHPFHEDTYLLQVRKGEAKYIYLLLRKSPSGVELNSIPCTEKCKQLESDTLLTLARSADEHFRQKEHIVATRTGDAN